MKTQYLEHQNKWTAFTTHRGLDMQEYGDTEKEARDKLANRIARDKPYEPKAERQTQSEMTEFFNKSDIVWGHRKHEQGI